MEHRMNPLKTVLSVALVSLALSACSGGDVASTTTVPPSTSVDPATTAVSGDFVFGSGELPDGFPDDFPIPNGSNVDATLVNTVTGFTEVAFLVPADVDVTALFYEQNLQARSYEFDATPSEGRWSFTFSKDDVEGTIDITAASAGISRATVTIPEAG
jgi:hypothetical protein